MYVNKKDDSKFLVCACHNIEHQLHVFKDDEDKIVYLSVHLVSGSFWQRLKNGIKYIFGHKSIYGDFDEFLFKEEHGKTLIELGEFLMNENKNKNHEIS